MKRFVTPKRIEGLRVCLAVAIVASMACQSERRFDVEEPQVFEDAGQPAEASCIGEAVRCSRDLRSVVDACDESLVVTTCRPDEGCAEGECVPACEAASSASVGCEFVAVTPSRYSETQGSCFGVVVTNTWGAPSTLDAEYAGTALDLRGSTRIVRTSGEELVYEPFSGELEPGQVAVMFLAHSPTRPQGPFPTGRSWKPCPTGITPAILADTSAVGTARSKSFRIKTSVPVSAYSLYQLGNSAAAGTATLLLPVPAWRRDYIAIDAWSYEVAAPTTQIVAAEDDTEVTIVGSVPILSGPGVEGAEKGSAQTYHLGRGEVLQFSQNQQLLGSRIAATKNIAVLGGHECLNVPTGYPYCDQASLQLFPVQSWGSEYAAAPYLSRRANGSPELVYYRIVAAVDGTELTYEPNRPKDAPAKLDGARSAGFMTEDPFVVRSQDPEHPIAVYQYMTGLTFADAVDDDGDPEFAFVIPTDQYLGQYVFYVDPGYRNSQLVVVRVRPEGRDFEPVVLDCAGELDGWSPLGSSGKYEYTRLRVPRAGQAKCGPGRHEMHSSAAFNVIVWGTDVASSYSYPGGAAIRALNSVETIVR